MTTTFERSVADSTETPLPYRLRQDFVPKGRYLSQEFLELELDRVFPRVWLAACREEELFDEGDFVEFTVGDLSLIIIRDSDTSIRAFHNACRHRGTRLLTGSGCVGEVRCRYHGWRWNLDGSSKLVLDSDDFEVPRCAEDLALQDVQVDTWGGWVFVNASRDPEPLLEFLDPIPEVLAPCNFEKMRYKYRKQVIVPVNWKAAMDAFIEGYHVPSTHPQTMRMGSTSDLPATLEELEFRAYIFSKSHNRKKHGNLGMFGRGRTEMDVSKLLWQFMDPADVVTMIEAQAAGLDRTPAFDLAVHEELRRTPRPDGVDGFAHYMALRRKHVEAAGIEWTELTEDQVEDIGIAWSVFPNLQISVIDVFGCLGFRARPNGHDPNSTIFEMFVLEKIPTAELNTKRVTDVQHVANWRDHDWGLLMSQDFKNYQEVVAGMRSESFEGYNLNPVQEGLVYHHHEVADEYLWDDTR